jgi:hypothetical protein
MEKISNIEKSVFISLFNRGGYVLDFSTDSFDTFTLQSIGLALCKRYGLSKGKSLAAYVNEANEDDVIKLLGDLLEHYEMYYQIELESDEKFARESQRFYTKCRVVMDRIKSNMMPFANAGETLKEKFSSNYISTQIDIMIKMQCENPTEAIGKSKELIESCCKTILEERGKTFIETWGVGQLVKETMKLLEISTENVNESTAEGKTVKAILGNLQGIAGNIAELRNPFGSGHGKSASYIGLTERHAKLAVGSSITLVNYLWDTHEWKQELEKYI